VLISWFIVSTFGYLFYKLSKEKPANFSLQLSCLARHNISCLARITGPLTCLTKTCRCGDKILHGKMSPEQQTVAMAGMKFQNPCFPRSYVVMATNVLPYEKRQFGASGRWRGRNPLAKKAHVTLATKSCLARKHFSAEV